MLRRIQLPTLALLPSAFPIGGSALSLACGFA
jgi:hypothetical protein